MKKEFAWAIGIGIFFGLIIAFGLWRINIAVKSGTKNNTPAIIVTPSPRAETPSQLKIAIDKPENGDVITEQTLNINGISKSSSIVVVSGETSDQITKTAANGLFDTQIELNSGINQITATSINQETQANTNVLIVYSSSFENKTSTQSASTEEKVDQQLKNLANKPKSFIGTVTDVTDNSLQIKTEKNEIKQISIKSDDTTAVNLKEATNKPAKLTDIAIGDFICALGYTNTTSVLSASRILITNPVTIPERKVVKTVYKKSELKTDKNTQYYKLENGETIKIKSTILKDGDNVIYVQVDEKVRTVFVIPPEVQ